MKILIQNAHTRKYYKAEDAWSGDVSDAFHFGVLADAARKALERENEDLNIVLRYEEPQCELAINPAFCV
jgi:hypothetical protein